MHADLITSLRIDMKMVNTQMGNCDRVQASSVLIAICIAIKADRLMQVGYVSEVAAESCPEFRLLKPCKSAPKSHGV